MTRSAKVLMGTYRILNTVTGHVYIGSTRNLRNRKHQHFTALRRNVHRNKALQEAWNQYGKDAFDFEVVELVADPKDLLLCEQRHLDGYSY